MNRSTHWKRSCSCSGVHVRSPGPIVIPTPSQRVVKDVEDAFCVMPPAAPHFDHFAPASHLVSHPELVIKLPRFEDALDRF